MSKNKKSLQRSKKKDKTPSVLTNLRAAAEGVNSAVLRLLQHKWSLLPLSLFMFGCIVLVYVCSGKQALSGEIPEHFYGQVQFYLLDYRAGFVPRAFIGSLLSVFIKKWSLSLITGFVRCAVVCSFALHAALAAAVLRRAYLRTDPFAAVLALYFVCCPLTTLQNIVYFGSLDLFNLILTLLFFMWPVSKAALMLTLPLCIVGVLIHPVFLLQCFPAILAIQFFYLMRERPLNKHRAAVLCLTVLLTIGVSFYLTFYARYTAAMTEDELYGYICGKFPFMGSTIRYPYSLGHYIYGQMNGLDISSAGSFIKNLLNIAVKSFTADILAVYLLLLVPLLAVFAAIWIFCFRHAEKGRKLPYLVFLLLPLLIVPGSLLLSDTMRTVSGVVITQFLLFFAVYRTRDTAPLREKARPLLRGPRGAAACCLFIAYLALCFFFAPALYR